MLRRVLGVIAVTLIALELGLTWLDPLGLAWVDQLGFIARYSAGETITRHTAPGQYRMAGWAATIDADGRRVVPGSSSGCRLVLFGDSVVWGWGVDDSATFANRLARDWPGQVINAGQIGHNSAQVRHTVESSTFDVGVYLISRNDAEITDPPWQYQPSTVVPIYNGFGLAGGRSALLDYGRYVLYLMGREANQHYPQDLLRFSGDLSAIAARGVTLVAFDAPLGRLAQAYAPVRLITPYDSTLGVIDWHPDARGHAHIAEQVAPMLAQLCSASPCAEATANDSCAV